MIIFEDTIVIKSTNCACQDSKNNSFLNKTSLKYLCQIQRFLDVALIGVYVWRRNIIIKHQNASLFDVAINMSVKKNLSEFIEFDCTSQYYCIWTVKKWIVEKNINKLLSLNDCTLCLVMRWKVDFRLQFFLYFSSLWTLFREMVYYLHEQRNVFGKLYCNEYKRN